MQSVVAISRASLANPLPLEQMFYNRSKNPESPDYVGLRGSSRIEGGPKGYLASLPGTSYSADLGGAIFACAWQMQGMVVLMQSALIMPGNSIRSSRYSTARDGQHTAAY